MKKIFINSKTREEYLHELWYNARYGGIKGTQLEWWTEDNWVLALKGFIPQVCNDVKISKKWWQFWK